MTARSLPHRVRRVVVFLIMMLLFRDTTLAISESVILTSTLGQQRDICKRDPMHVNITCDATGPQKKISRWSSPELIDCEQCEGSELERSPLEFHLSDKTGTIAMSRNLLAAAILNSIDNTTSNSRFISTLIVKIPNSVNFTQFTVTCDGQSEIYALIDCATTDDIKSTAPDHINDSQTTKHNGEPGVPNHIVSKLVYDDSIGGYMIQCGWSPLTNLDQSDISHYIVYVNGTNILSKTSLAIIGLSLIVGLSVIMVLICVSLVLMILLYKQMKWRRVRSTEYRWLQLQSEDHELHGQEHWDATQNVVNGQYLLHCEIESDLQIKDRKSIKRELEQTDVKQLQQKLADYQRRCDELEQQFQLEQQQNRAIQEKLKKENAEAQKCLLDANRKIYQFQEIQLNTSEKLQLTHVQYHNQGEEMNSTSQSRYFNEAKSRANISFLHHQVFECDSSCQELHIEDHDVTLTIPKGAVTKGKKLYLEVGVAMYGPFIFSRDVQPISPILWLCPLDGDFAVNKPILIKLQHFLTGLSTDKLQDHEIAFMKANHLDKIDQHGQISYNFQDVKGSKEFRSDGYKSYGVLAIEHCCFYCLTAKKSPEMFRDATYCLTRIERPSPPRCYEIHFAATYFLDTCLRAVEEQYPVKEGYKISNRKNFKFEQNETEPYANLKIAVPEDERYAIGMDPTPAEIQAEKINFWGVEYSDMLLKHQKRMYPPRVTFTVILKTTDPITLPIMFDGSLMKDHGLNIQLALSSDQLSDVKQQLATLHNEHLESSAIGQRPLDKLPTLAELMILKYRDQKVRIISEASCKWKDIASIICDEPNKTSTLEEKCHGDPNECLRQTFIENFISKKPKNYSHDWSGLIELLDDVGLETLAENVKQALFKH